MLSAFLDCHNQQVWEINIYEKPEIQILICEKKIQLTATGFFVGK